MAMDDVINKKEEGERKLMESIQNKWQELKINRQET